MENQTTASGRADIHQKAWKYVYSMNTVYHDNLKRNALEDGNVTYSYEKMFLMWRRYASVFSALKMTGVNKARVGLVGSTAAEVAFAFYGLNMVGAEVSMLSCFTEIKMDGVIQAVRDEHLTDVILTDDFLQPDTLQNFLAKKDSLGLRNILVLRIPVSGAAVPAPVTSVFSAKTCYLQQMFAPVYMDYLLNVYQNYPVSYGPEEDSGIAVILHTSGTTGGQGHPIVMSDSALNAVCNSILQLEQYDFLTSEMVSIMMIDLQNVYGFADQLHLPLSCGCKVVCSPGLGLNPLVYKAISHHKVTLLFCVKPVLEMWMSMPDDTPFDFSSLRGVVFGGSTMTARDKKRFYEFFRKHGAGKIPLLNGYGISEAGGACTLSTEDLNDEAIGYLLPDMELRLFDEESETFFGMEGAPGIGVLYIHSESMSHDTLDGKQIIKTRMIDGKLFVSTNDLVSIDETGKITYLCRASRFFINSTGVKYQSGLVEAEVLKQEGIGGCGIVPVLDKMVHDTVPMLCVETTGDSFSARECVQNALTNIFVSEHILEVSQIPRLVLSCDTLPRNANGKLDLFRINHGEIDGTRYIVEPQWEGEALKGIVLAEDTVEDNYTLQFINAIASEIADSTGIQKENKGFSIDIGKIIQVLRLFPDLAKQIAKIADTPYSCQNAILAMQFVNMMIYNKRQQTRLKQHCKAAPTFGQASPRMQQTSFGFPGGMNPGFRTPGMVQYGILYNQYLQIRQMYDQMMIYYKSIKDNNT